MRFFRMSVVIMAFAAIESHGAVNVTASREYVDQKVTSVSNSILAVNVDFDKNTTGEDYVAVENALAGFGFDEEALAEIPGEKVYGSIGALLVALVAAVAWLKRNKASLTQDNELKGYNTFQKDAWFNGETVSIANVLLLSQGWAGLTIGGLPLLGNEDFVNAVLETAYSKDQVDDKINQNAAHYLTKRTGTEGHYSYPQFATHADLAAAKAAHTEANPQFFYGNEAHTPDKNDYCIVLADETHGGGTTRYMFVGSWNDNGYFRYQYTINETAFTDEQLAAIDSGATKAKIDSIDIKRDKTDLKTYRKTFTLWDKSPEETSIFTPDAQPIYSNGKWRCTVNGGSGEFESMAHEDAVQMTLEGIGEYSGAAIDMVRTETGILSTNDDLAKISDISVALAENEMPETSQSASPLSVASRIKALENKPEGEVKSEAVANKFDITKPYKAHQYVMYNGELYRALEDIPAGEWNEAKWKAVGATDSATYFATDDDGHLRVRSVDDNTDLYIDLYRITNTVKDASIANLGTLTDANKTIPLPYAIDGHSRDFVVIFEEGDTVINPVLPIVESSMVFSDEIPTFAVNTRYMLCFTEVDNGKWIFKAASEEIS